MDFKKLRLELIEETKQKIAKSIGDDNFISQAINTISEIDRAVNILSKRLREWYELFNPELSHSIKDHQVFVEKLLGENSKVSNSMGADLEDFDTKAIFNLVLKIKALYDEKDSLVDYIRDKMAGFCPNVLEICGPLIGAKLIAHKGTLRELAFMPASTIQLLGAEKALFRHLRSNAKSPKYGYILQHQDVAKAENRGKAARQLANKISLAAKKDYFSKEGTP